MRFALYRCAECLFKVDSFEALRLHYAIVHLAAAPSENDPHAYDHEAVAAWYAGQDWTEAKSRLSEDERFDLIFELRERWAKRPEADR